MALRDNMVSWWELNETSGTRADAHGSNNLTDNNTVLSATGIQGNGADFESTNSEYLSIANGSQTGLNAPGSAFSISAWVKPESTGAYRPIVGNWASSTNRGYDLGINSDGTIIMRVLQTATGSVYSNAVTTTALSTGTWYHVVGTWNSSDSDCLIYINGSLATLSTSTSNATSVNNPANNWYIGGMQGPIYYADGVIDEVGFFSAELSASEVTELYNSGAGLSYADTAGGGGGGPASATFISLLGAG